MSAAVGRTARLRCVFVRHGESANNLLFVDGKGSWEYFEKHRVADPPLTETGKKQAENVAEFLSSKPPLLDHITELYVSPMKRTLMTTAPVANTLGLIPMVVADCYEVGGCYSGSKGEPGMSAAEIRDLFGYTVEVGSNGMRDDGWYPPHLNKESHEHAEKRAAAVIERLRERASAVTVDTTIVLVMHHDFIDLLLRSCNGGMPSVNAMPPGKFHQHFNCAMSVVDFLSSRECRILFTNRFDYLDPKLIKSGFLGDV